MSLSSMSIRMVVVSKVLERNAGRVCDEVCGALKGLAGGVTSVDLRTASDSNTQSNPKCIGVHKISLFLERDKMVLQDDEEEGSSESAS